MTKGHVNKNGGEMTEPSKPYPFKRPVSAESEEPLEELHKWAAENGVEYWYNGAVIAYASACVSRALARQDAKWKAANLTIELEAAESRIAELEQQIAEMKMEINEGVHAQDIFERAPLVEQNQELKSVAKLLRMKLDVAESRITELERIGKALLYHDERGQGIGWQEAMKALAAALKEKQ